jgi:hypothetical protein
MATGGMCLLAVAYLAAGATGMATQCPNAALRVGRSAALPDCRAYELVTPTNLGRTQDISFTGGKDHALPSAEGEHIVLVASSAYLEPSSVFGTLAVFFHGPEGWSMNSSVVPGAAGDFIAKELFSPDLSQVALRVQSALSAEDTEYQVGPVGGPYSTVARVPIDDEESTRFRGANAGTNSVPALSDVLLQSGDHVLLPQGRERQLAEETTGEAADLYEWTDGRLRLVNVEGERASLKLVNPCEAVLGAGRSDGSGTLNAVSADGSRIFFETERSGPKCEGPSRLYMRVDGRETAEVSAPQGVTLAQSARQDVFYAGATPDGSTVFFVTAMALTPGGGYGLYEYDTEAPMGHRLRFITPDIRIPTGLTPTFLMSQNGSMIYYEFGGSIYYYETGSGDPPSFVAHRREAPSEGEPFTTTADGAFLLFPATEVAGEPRGAGHDKNELYRYDRATGDVMCVSCGAGIAPAEGEYLQRADAGTNGELETPDEIPAFREISEDGRRVFFQTTARLVPQDTNSTESQQSSANGTPGMDVYEWEEGGTEEAPGIFCDAATGCTHLISTGEAVGPEVYLGASANGNNVFFASAAQLVPQATPEFTNIYDARVDGGLPALASTARCVSCQGVGVSLPQFGAPASGTFVGVGNPAPVSGSRKVTGCAKGRRRVRTKCVKVKLKVKQTGKVKTKRHGQGRRA